MIKALSLAQATAYKIQLPLPLYAFLSNYMDGADL